MSGFGEKETAALAKLEAAGVKLTGGGEAGLDLVPRREASEGVQVLDDVGERGRVEAARLVADNRGEGLRDGHL